MSKEIETKMGGGEKEKYKVLKVDEDKDEVVCICFCIEFIQEFLVFFLCFCYNCKRVVILWKF